MNFKSLLKNIGVIAVMMLIFNQSGAQSTDKMNWWKDAKFGMFLHWGLYSKTAGYWKGHKAKGNEHFMIHEKISLKEYATIADDFNPVNFNAESWVLTAKQAGMKYIIITSKHHDGFAMFNSPSSNYNIVERTPYAKDPMKTLVKACHKHGMKFGFYYSLGRDWEDPDVPTDWPFKGGRSNIVDYPDEDKKVFNKYFERKVKPQVKELLTQYGKIDIMWFDTPHDITVEESQELRNLILSIQPKCIINSRIGNNLGDYNVKEQKIAKDVESKPWEACITMGKNWGYIEYDTLYKSPELMARHLLEIVSKGGNLLLNNGPTAKGEITHMAKERLAKIGKWMDENSEGIYGSKPWKIQNELLTDQKISVIIEKKEDKNTLKDAVHDATPKDLIPEVQFTFKNGNVYAYVCSYQNPEVLIKSFASKYKIKNVTQLGTNKKVVWKQNGEGLTIELPKYTENEIPIQGFEIQLL